MIERADPVNWSTLKAMCQSPRHYRHGLTVERADSDAMQLGRLTHAMVYEAAEVAARYVLLPRFNRAMKDATAIEKGYDGGREAAEAFDAGEREAIKPDLWTRATSMAASLASDPVAARMIVGGYAEQRIEWTDEATGIACRGRVDHVNGRLSDLKTSITIEPRQFAAKIVHMGYHAQLAYYLDGLTANGVALDERPALIVVESMPPHDVVVLEFSDRDIATGRAVYRRCLDTLAMCRAADSWPGVGGGMIQPVMLPAWAAPVEDDEAVLTMGGEPMF